MNLDFDETESQKVYFTSDWHLNHKLDAVWKGRGYLSIEEHNNGVIKSINDVVRPDDILFNLGDFCLHSSVDDFERFILQINCKNVYMLFGNHPNRHYKEIYKPLVRQVLGENYNNDSEVYPLRYKNIIYMGHYIRAIINNHCIIMSHYPFMIWDNVQNGSIALCGHSHGHCSQTNSTNIYGKILDCSWDEFKKPLSLNEVLAIVNGKRYLPNKLDHHSNMS